jgi:RHS repeat-associated protein
MTVIIGVMGMCGAEKPQSLNGSDSALPRYDAAGNITYDPSNVTAHTYQWDAEGRVSKVDPGLNPPTWVFTYNALGHRVQFASPTMGELRVFDPGGNWLGLANANTYTLVRFGDRHLIVDEPTETYFHHVNVLGSTSMMTDHLGNHIEDLLFYPWGDVWQSAGNGGYSLAKIPYYDLSTNTTLANARVLGVNFGRWFSPDPGGAGARPTDPQTWNMYAYVGNNPTNSIDPTGLADYYVFLPLAPNVSNSWAAIQAEAPKYGNTVTIYPGATATTGNFQTALQTPNANVVFTGHSNLNADHTTIGIDMGDSHAVGIPQDPNSWTAGPDGLPQAPVSDLSANSVALFGCDTNTLAPLFAGTIFKGTRPTINTDAQDAGARAYTDTLVRNGTVDQATSAAQASMVSTTNRANQNPDRSMTYRPPDVCTTGPDGKQTCR